MIKLKILTKIRTKGSVYCWLYVDRVSVQYYCSRKRMFFDSPLLKILMETENPFNYIAEGNILLH